MASNAMFWVCELSLFPVDFRVLLYPINFSSFSSLKNPFFNQRTFHPHLCLHLPLVLCDIKSGVKNPTNNKQPLTSRKIHHHSNNKNHNFTKEREVFLIEMSFCTLQMNSASPDGQNVRRKNDAGCCALNRSQWNAKWVRWSKEKILGQKRGCWHEWVEEKKCSHMKKWAAIIRLLLGGEQHCIYFTP